MRNHRAQLVPTFAHGHCAQFAHAHQHGAPGAQQRHHQFPVLLAHRRKKKMHLEPMNQPHVIIEQLVRRAVVFLQLFHRARNRLSRVVRRLLQQIFNLCLERILAHFSSRPKGFYGHAHNVTTGTPNSTQRQYPSHLQRPNS